MALSRVQVVSGINTGFASTVPTTSFTSTVGNFLIGIAEADTVAANGITFTDNKGNTWNRVKSVSVAATFDLELWWAKVTTGGAGHIVTAADNGGGVDSLIIVEEWSGQDTTSPSDVSVTNSGTATAATSTATGTTAVANEVVIGAFAASGSRTFTLGSGFSNGTKVNTSFSSIFFESQIVSATGAQTATATISASVSYAAICATFKQAGGVTTPNSGFLIFL